MASPPQMDRSGLQPPGWSMKALVPTMTSTPFSRWVVDDREPLGTDDDGGGGGTKVRVGERWVVVEPLPSSCKRAGDPRVRQERSHHPEQLIAQSVDLGEEVDDIAAGVVQPAKLLELVAIA